VIDSALPIHTELLLAAEAGFDSSDDAFLQHLRRQTMQGALERVPGVDALAVDPCLTILPVHIVAEELAVKLVHIGIVGEHDVTGVIEREPVVFHRPAPTADRWMLFEQQTALAEMIRSAQAGRSRTNHDRGVLAGRTRQMRFVIQRC
jgi:hypothetical protein